MKKVTVKHIVHKNLPTMGLSSFTLARKDFHNLRGDLGWDFDVSLDIVEVIDVQPHLVKVSIFGLKDDTGITYMTNYIDDNISASAVDLFCDMLIQEKLTMEDNRFTTYRDCTYKRFTRTASDRLNRVKLDTYFFYEHKNTVAL